jgi:hypothetical protein
MSRKVITMKTIHKVIRAFSVGGLLCLFLFTPAKNSAAQACIEPPPDLVSWWPGDGNADDIQGGNHGRINSGVTFASGMVGQAFSFDDTGRMNAPTSGLPIGNHDRTLELWVKVDNFIAGEAYFAGYGNFGSFNKTYHLGTTGNVLFFSQWGHAVTGPALQTDRWYHVAVTNIGSFVTLYLDGTVVATNNLRISTPEHKVFHVGSLPDDTYRRLDGRIDEVGIYSRALSTTEIQAIFTAGTDGKCKYGP